MLFFWVFGLVAGWANACLLQVRSAAHAADTHAVSSAQHRVPGPALDAASDQGSAGGEVCLSLCDSERGAIPKHKLPQVADHDLAHAAPVGQMAWSADMTPVRRQPPAVPPPGPPPTIRFVRLAR